MKALFRQLINKLVWFEKKMFPTTFESCGARATKQETDLKKHELDQIAARNIRISLDKRIAKSTASPKKNKGKDEICDKNKHTVLANSSQLQPGSCVTI